jgi:hypothetical protein
MSVSALDGFRQKLTKEKFSVYGAFSAIGGLIGAVQHLTSNEWVGPALLGGLIGLCLLGMAFRPHLIHDLTTKSESDDF